MALILAGAGITAIALGADLLSLRRPGGGLAPGKSRLALSGFAVLAAGIVSDFVGQPALHR